MIDGKAGGCNRSDGDRKSTRLNSRHGYISYAVFCLKKKGDHRRRPTVTARREFQRPPPYRGRAPHLQSPAGDHAERIPSALLTLELGHASSSTGLS